MSHWLDVLKKKPEEESPAEAEASPKEEVPVEVKVEVPVPARVGPRLSPPTHDRLHAFDSALDHSGLSVINPADGEVLTYEEAEAKWKNKAMSGMVIHGNEYHDPDFSEITHTHDQLHDRLHALDSVLDHSGEITDAQHGVRTLASAHAHSALSGIGADDHHNRLHALDDALDHSGVITDAQHGDKTTIPDAHHDEVHGLDHAQHPDVEITSPANDEVLTYEEATALWKNKTPSIEPPLDKVRCYKSAAQSIPNNTLTTLSFDLESFDVGDMHSNVTNNERITVQEDGYYLLVGVVMFAASSTGQRGIFAYKGLSQLSTSYYQAVQNGFPTICFFLDFQSAVAGDYFLLKVYQNSGGALNVLAGSGATVFVVSKIL